MHDQDYGGELDPHGADLASLPLRLIRVKSSFIQDYCTSSQATPIPVLIITYRILMSGNVFCVTINPASRGRLWPHRLQLQHVQKDTFEVCGSDLKGQVTSTSPAALPRPTPGQFQALSARSTRPPFLPLPTA
ncbi:hypothetical protein BDR03DRAFT_1050226 [Suillus americanus]|nr:hypothetical protein BDR03DRAFT_1050226 [Suillus americanus]